MAEDAADKIVKGIEDEVSRIRKAAEKAREDNGADKGETEEEYYERIANVPGIFGDTDTIAGDVPSRNNEEATVAAAEVEASDDNATSDDARRQVDVAADDTPSGDEIEAKTEADDVKPKGRAPRK